MASIVFAAAVPHLSYMIRGRDLIDAGQRNAIDAAFARLADELRASRADALVVFGPDHYNSFFLSNMPAFCIGTGTLSTSCGDAGLPVLRIPIHGEISGALVEGLHESGHDVAFASNMPVDHAFACPLSLLHPELSIPMVPVFVNCGAPPLAPVRRSHALGRAMAGVCTGMPDGLRIALLATGGLSHTVPIPKPDAPADALEAEMVRLMHGGAPGQFEALLRQRAAEWIRDVRARVNEGFDREVIQRLAAGEGELLAGRSTDWIETEGGNGGQEIRTWLAVAGATGDARGEALFYEPMPRWLTGICVFRWQVVH